MSDDATPAKVRLTDGLGQGPDRAAYARWMAASHAPALRRMDSDGAHAAGYAAGVAAERERLAAYFDDGEYMMYRSEVAAAIRRA